MPIEKDEHKERAQRARVHEATNLKKKLPESVAEVFQLPDGKLLIRPKEGRRLQVTGYADTSAQPDGGVVLAPVPEEITSQQAGRILGMPASTLRWMVSQGALPGFCRRPRRLCVMLKDVLELNRRRRSDPDFWAKHKFCATAPGAAADGPVTP